MEEGKGGGWEEKRQPEGERGGKEESGKPPPSVEVPGKSMNHHPFQRDSQPYSVRLGTNNHQETQERARIQCHRENPRKPASAGHTDTKPSWQCLGLFPYCPSGLHVRSLVELTGTQTR